ncbi:MAG TPA: glycosyltransferase [Woeseiaceae bacterium]|nr:glycosyltransferase [Woeseiaceae bacterium]
MKILFIAPQPYFEERGTPIAVDLMLKALSERGDEIDLLTFHIGKDRHYPGVTVMRSKPPLAPASIPPGFSFKKAWCDVFLLRQAFRMVRAKRYDLIHAVEEASFIAMALGKVHRVPYVFDMDSSMALQLLSQFRWLRPARGLLHWIEALPMRQAIAVVPMCEDLAIHARLCSRGIVRVLKDVSLISEPSDESAEDLRREFGIEGPLLLYVGNLEYYQGIELLFDSFVQVLGTHPDARLVVIGGRPRDVRKYGKRARLLRIDGSVHLTGPRPVAALGGYLKQADLLISPRIHGNNTPMKIYSYLDSGVAVVATALPTHTQVMSESEAALTAPEPAAMAATIARLLDDPQERERLAQSAQSLIRREHSWPSFRKHVDLLFGELEGRLEPSP